MKKRTLGKTVLLVLIVAICFMFSVSCGSSSNENKLIGIWELESQTNSKGSSTSWDLETLEFFSDGTCTVNGEAGTWKVVDGKLMVLGDYGGRFYRNDSIVGEYTIKGDTLKISDASIDGKNNSVNLVYRKAD